MRPTVRFTLQKANVERPGSQMVDSLYGVLLMWEVLGSNFKRTMVTGYSGVAVHVG